MIFFKNNLSANYEKIFYDFKVKDISGNELNLKKFENKVILLVNTASYCGFTKQYNDLQYIWDKYKNNNFVVLAAPSNSFNQEKDTNKEVKEFCEFNFNITFPSFLSLLMRTFFAFSQKNGFFIIMQRI